MDRLKTSRWGVARKLIGAVSVAALTVGLMPAMAFATDSTGEYYVDLPKANEVIAFEHTANDNGHDYTFEYVTIGSSETGRVAPMAQTWYEAVGLNYTNAYNGPGSIYAGATGDEQTPDPSSGYSNYTKGEKGSLKSNNSTLVIIGSSNNVSPDEYIWNYCCWANGADVAEDSRAVDHGNRGTGAVSLEIGGTTYADFPRQVYMECNIIGEENGSAQYQGTSYTDWIALENQRANRPKQGTYDPYFAKYSVSGQGAAGSVKVLHTLADTVDKVIAQTVDENGNYALQSRYGGNRPDGTGASIDQFEDIVLGTQYYVLSKLADKTIDKKVTAVLIGYDPKTGNYACRKYNTDKDPNGNQYGGRVTNYLASISTSITEVLGENAKAMDVVEAAEADYVVWYTPQQIVENCDAAFVCDCYSANSVSTYLATASAGQDQKCYTVYSPPGVTRAEEDNTADLKAAINEAKAAGKKTCDFCFSYPANMFGNFYAQGVENGMLSLICASFTYPELNIDLTDMLAYWAKYVWHIKDSALQTVITATCGDMNLSGDTQIGEISANYEDNAELIFAQGNQYYLDNYAEIDALNGGNLKTYNLDNLKVRTAAYFGDTSFLVDKIGEAKSELTKAETKINELQESNAAKDEEIAEAQQQLTEATNTVASLNAEVADLTAKNTAKDTDLRNAQNEVKDLQNQITALNQQLNTVKQSNTIAVQSTVSQTYSAKALKKKAQSFTINAAAMTTPTFKVTKKNAKISVTSAGKVTVKKGTKKGTYKVTVQVSAPANDTYAAAADKTVTVKVKVTK